MTTSRRRIKTPFISFQRGPAAEGYVPTVILENGTIRTLDPALPTARALAIAGDRIAGGIGTHETALASPDRADLGGRPAPDPARVGAHARGGGRARGRGCEGGSAWSLDPRSRVAKRGLGP